MNLVAKEFISARGDGDRNTRSTTGGAKIFEELEKIRPAKEVA